LDYALASEKNKCTQKEYYSHRKIYGDSAGKYNKEYLGKYPKSPKAWTESPDPVGELSDLSTGFYFEK